MLSNFYISFPQLDINTMKNAQSFHGMQYFEKLGQDFQFLLHKNNLLLKLFPDKHSYANEETRKKS